MALLLRRGTNTQRLGITFADGELVYTTDNKKLYIGDGSAAGGNLVSGMNNLLEDQTPQLAGNLDLNGNDVVGTGNINISGSLSIGTGFLSVDIKGSVFANDSGLLVDGINGKLVLANNLISDIGNVASIAPSNGNVLAWNSGTSKWTPTDYDLTAQPISELSDVNASSPQDKQALVWDSGTSKWIAGDVVQQGEFLDGDFRGSLFGDNSTLIVDGLTNTLLGDARLDTVTITTNLTCEAEVPGEFNANITGNDDNSVIRLNRKFVNTAETDTTRLGIIKFSSIAANSSQTTYGQIDGRKGYTWLSSSLAANYVDTTNTAHLFLDGSNGCIGVGKRSASFKLDVDGEIVSTSYIQFGNLTTTERNNLTALNGMVIYNITNNKFEGYQNGAWINIDDGQPAT